MMQKLTCESLEIRNKFWYSAEQSISSKENFR
jgi:hypothetical protein